MENFLPLRREIREHWVYKDNDYFKVWVDILFNARFSKEPKTDIYKGTIYTINYSEFLYSRPSYSQRLNIAESKLRNLMDNLIKDNMIEKVISLGRNKATIYKVINYEKYNNAPTEYIGIKGVEGSIDQLTTNSQPTDNQLTTNSQPLKKIDKIDKKEKQEDRKEDIYSIFDHYSEVFMGYYKTISLTPARVKHIKSRLEKYSVEQIKSAITNIRTSKYHLGEEPNNDKFYATLEFICRNDETLEKWINHIPKKSGNANTNKALELYEQAKTEEGEPVW
jgi:hypothetical protein